jgi:hypothetical protein
MNYYQTWAENRPKIPPGKYQAKCLKAEKSGIWHAGQGGWGRSEKVVLWFQIFGGECNGIIIPTFLTIGENGSVHQGSKYFIFWCIANGLRKPLRSRLKEMPLSKFETKFFDVEIVDAKPKLNGRELPGLFTYSRVDCIYELLVGNPDS